MILSQPFRSLGVANFRIGAFLLAVCFSLPASGAFLAPPAPPTGLAVRAVADNAIYIEWLHSGEDVVRFVIYRSADLAGPFERITSTPRSRRNYTDVDLIPNTEYCYLVEAENNEGSAASAPVCARTLPTRPAAPTNLTVTQVEGSPYLDLTWQHADPDRSVSFVIYRQWVPGDPLPLPIDTVAAPPFRDLGGRASTQTCYSVSALSMSGESLPSPQVCLTPLFTTAALPTNITAFARSASLIDITWNLPVYNYATLLLERSVDGAGFSLLTTFEEKALGYADVNLSADTGYCYRLKAINPVSESAYSAPICARTPHVQPAAPVLVRVTTAGVNDLEVVWEAPSLPRHWFEVRRRKAGEVFVTIADSVTALSLIDSGLAELTQYCYVVRTLNRTYASASSNELCGSTGLETPSAVGDLTATPDPANPTAALSLTWSAASPSAFTAYEIDVREPEGDWSRAQLTSNIFATVSGLRDATRYELRVTAVRTVDTSTARSAPVQTTARTFLAHWAGDTNGDGSVTAADVVFLTSAAVYGQSTPFNSDGKDVSWRLRAIEVGESDPALLRGDTDRSGRIDLFDFLAIAANFGQTVPGAGPPMAAVLASTEHAETLRALVSSFQPESEPQIELAEELSLLLEAYQAHDRPDQVRLSQNYPNPFNPQTTIRYDLPEKGVVRLSIFNPLGQEVVRLVDGELDAGRYASSWDASDLPSGVYLCVLRTPTATQTRTMTLLR
jgi:hypothetical protein